MVSNIITWREGVILSLGVTRRVAFDVLAQREVALDDVSSTLLQELCSGLSAARAEADIGIGELWRLGLLQRAPWGVDGVIQARLQALDASFAADWLPSLTPRAQEAYDHVLRTHAMRKRFWGEAGQSPILPESAMRRAMHVGDSHDVGVKRIVCLGDDDFVSVALAGLGHTVTVCDIDTYVLTLAARGAAALPGILRAQEYDLRDPIAPEDLGAYDVFLVDPMSNADFFALALSRGLAMLAPGGCGYVAVYPAAAVAFTEVATRLHLDIAAYHAGHNNYYSRHLAAHDYASDWVCVKPTQRTQALIRADTHAVFVDFYREDAFRPPRPLGIHIEAIDNARYTEPMFLEQLAEYVATTCAIDITHLVMLSRPEWTIMTLFTSRGTIVLRGDREHNTLTVALRPCDEGVQQSLLAMLVSVHKGQVREIHTGRYRDFIELLIA